MNCSFARAHVFDDETPAAEYELAGVMADGRPSARGWLPACNECVVRIRRKVARQHGVWRGLSYTARSLPR